MNNEQQKIIKKVANEVKQKLEGEESGHDWWHIVRVWNMAKHIGKIEDADMIIVELAALLHDIADWKFYDGDDTIGPQIARRILEKYSVPAKIIDCVCDIIADMSFKGAGVKTEMKTLEGEIVQDSDRLDAIGAIGIARTFSYGGHENRPIHDPAQKPIMHQTKEDYFKSGSPTIKHFYEKLLLLKNRMNTKTAKKLAEGRHRFMEEYLDKFFQEWDGKI
ncbi:MAG: HD domain-containing protein [Patescibacteria group bacterium]|nr:HD domain-containing protein [Patescibacteria group bacterium]